MPELKNQGQPNEHAGQESAEALRQRVLGLIDTALRICPTRKEIESELGKCRFLDGIRLNFITHDIPYSTYQSREFSDLIMAPGEDDPAAWERLKKELAKIHGRKQLLQDGLNIIQFDFSRIGLERNAGAVSAKRTFDSKSYDFILLDSNGTESQKKEEMEKQLAVRVLDEEIGWLDGIKEKSQLQKIGESRRNLAKLRNGVESLLEIPPEVLGRHAGFIEDEAKKYIIENNKTRIFELADIPHEAFHYFFNNQLFRPGYGGPGAVEIMRLALKGLVDRYADKETGKLRDADYTDMDERLNAILEEGGKNSINRGNIVDFAMKIIADAKGAGTKCPVRYPKENWEKLTESRREEVALDMWIIDSFHQFLTEYLARIYDGALGNTPEKIEGIIGKNAAQFGQMANPWFEEKNDYGAAYHTPSFEEIELLKKMRWNGKPIL